ncbi:type I restriction/modification system, specificity subunit [Campylobacter sp. RM5004]|uniref:restriction endonuclease subunit S n=1 Tax=Campylobacter sp. RM5004 TaxID=1660078 RepID=UPI001EFAECBA|nr:restriction endonuclease subunit S [Campylobacter sp. RM5004]ULO00742.1 type I restriction/modification system, specificity subunit [Campylobacter sp. RM5004]
MNNWKKCKLGDAPLEFIDGDRGKNYPKQNEFHSNEYCLFLSTKNVRENGFDFSECQFITKEKDEILKKGKLKINDLVLTTRGTIGNLALYKENISYKNIRINSGMLIIRPNNEELDSRYAFYLFKNLKDEFDNFVSGSAQPQLPIRDLKEVEITLPPLEEQRQIAAILSSIDDKIELLHEQNKTLEELAQTLFRHYFIENPNPSWQEKPLSDFGNIICGKTPSKKVNEYYNGDIPFIKIPDMHGNIFVFKTNEYLSELGSQTQINKLIPKKSICVSCIATVGVVSMNAFESYTNQQINSIVPKKEHYRYFLYLYMKHLYDYLQSMASGGTATANLNTRDFSNIHILMPDEEIMINFNGKTSEYFDKIFKNLEQIQTLENMRDILIPKLLNGEIKVGGNQ